MIKVDGLYYVWYSKSYGPTDGFAGDIENDKVFPWDRCDIWYATSEDGITWKEQGLAVARGPKGSYDDRSVFTTEIMEWDGKYYLSYQCVKSPYEVRVKNTVGMAAQTSTDLGQRPACSCSEQVYGRNRPELLPQRRRDFDFAGAYIGPYKGKFTYIICEREWVRRLRSVVARSHGVASPTTHYNYTQIVTSDHQYRRDCMAGNGGVGLPPDGVEKNTIQWSPTVSTSRSCL